MKIVAVVGTYRKGGIVDTAVDEILDAARAEGAEVSKICLLDKRVEFCTNCRGCTQQEGRQRGACAIDDDVRSILDELESADAFVLASPMNFGTVTAITKRFIERLVCFAYWPWGQPAPKLRGTNKGKRAILVGSSAAPAIVARIGNKMVSLMKSAANILGAKKPRVLFIGMAAMKPHQKLRERTANKARRLGRQLVSGR